MIDAIKGEDNCWSWGRAKIEVITDDGGNLSLEFENEDVKFDKTVSRWSPDIAPLNENSSENDWKSALKVDDEIDCYDKSKNWYACTIVDLKEEEKGGKNWTKAKIGFRIYSDEGAKEEDLEDGTKKKFDGWSSKLDEWHSIISPNVDTLYSHAKPHKSKNRSTTFVPYWPPKVDDSNDPS